MKKTAASNLFVVAGIALIAAIACQAPAPPPPDYAAEYGPLADTYVDAWSTGNLEQLDAVMSADVRRTAPPSGPGNAGSLAELKDVMRTFRTGWPDTKVVFDEGFYMENVSFHHWTFTGTNTGEGETPPSGVAAEVSGVTIFRYADGKIIDEHVEWDTLDFMQPLGYTLAAVEAESSGD